MDGEGINDFKMCNDGRLRRKKSGIEARLEESADKIREMSDTEALDEDTRLDMKNIGDELERVAPIIAGYERLAEKGE